MTKIPPEHYDAVFRTSFMAFAEKSFEITSPGREFRDNWHLHVIAKALEDRRASGFGRLIINMPPRSMKSLLVSVAWPAFCLGHDPTAKFMVVSYNEVLAAQLSRATRRLMTSGFYRRIFPETRLIAKPALLLETEQGGQRLATTMDGAGTGLGAQILIFDDPMSAGAAASTAERERTKRNFDEVFSSRLDDPLAGIMIVVAQRLCEDDVPGHLIAKGGWDHLWMPAMAMENIRIGPEIGGPHLYRKGEVLHPGRFSPAQLDQQRIALGAAVFEAQYQQNPIPEGGYIIKRDWLQRYDQAPGSENGTVTLSVDTAAKTTPANDYSVVTVWLRRDEKHYLLHVFRDRVEFTDLERTVLDLHRRFEAHHVLVEDHGTGTGLIQRLRRTWRLPAIGFKPREPKDVRLSNVSSYFQQGFVWLPQDAPWLADFERELCGFPNTKHDDQVDSVSQYLAWAEEKFAGVQFHADFGHDEPIGSDHDGIAEHLAWRRFRR